MNRLGIIRQQLVPWALILLVWCLLVLAFAGQLVFNGVLGWEQAIRVSLHDWTPWAILAPVVAWLAAQFPLERQKLVISIPLHIVVCMLCVLFFEILPRPFAQGPRPPAGPQHLIPGAPSNPQFSRELAPPHVPELGFPPIEPPPARSGRPHLIIRQAQFNIPVYWIIVSIVHALSYYRRSEERERRARELEASLAEAKLQALRMQLHPHFLFNTLHAISTLVHKKPNAADEMIGNLSELLRITLDASSQQVISLRRELEFLDRYLDIQKVRFGDRLRVEKHIDTMALEAAVPTLILQPLVENAIRHGIESLTSPGLISIRAHREGGRLHLSVRDNGPGLKNLPKQHQGVGLANTKARLQELYGAGAEIVLNNVAEGGCEVEVSLPYTASPPTTSKSEASLENSHTHH